MLLAYSGTPAQTELIVPFFKQVTYPLGMVGFVILTYFVIVGTQQRGQPDRRAGWAGDPAHCDGGQRPGRVRLRRGQRRVLASTSAFRTSPAPAS